MSEPVKVPAEVLAGLNAVRESGRVNMFDAPGVQEVANQLGHHALVVWMEDQMIRRTHSIRYGRPSDYSRGLWNGFEAEEGSEHA